MASKNGDADSVVVIGLGRFGGTLAEALSALGHEVLGVDENLKNVQDYADRLTHVVQADATDDGALRQLGIADFDRAVVAIGADLEASVLTVVALAEAGVPEIWAKAISKKHAKILTAVGAHRVVSPEAEMGERVAHLITSRMLDFFEFVEGFAIAKTHAPQLAIGVTLAEAALRTKFGITVVAVKAPGGDFAVAQPDTVVPAGGLLIVAGTAEQVQLFSAVT